jgi:hypothetical protein
MINKMHKALILISIFLLSGCVLISPKPIQTPSAVETNTAAPLPTYTLVPTVTIEPTATSTPPPAIYFPQPGTPAYIANFAHPSNGCNWLGVAGQVFGPDDLPVLNLIVSVKGKLGSTVVDAFSMTGLAEGDPYGPGGYEIKLANQTYSTSKNLAIQVFDLNAKPLSSPLTFDTFLDCGKNLIIINFTIDEN